MIDWGREYTSEWRVFHVNSDTWANMDLLERVESISIERDGSDDVPMLESASMSVNMDLLDTFVSGWYRIVGLFRQGREREQLSLGTFLFESGSASISYPMKTPDITGYSVLKTCSDKKLKVGTYAPKNIDGVKYVEELLKECIPAGCDIFSDDSFILDDYIVFDAGSSYLEAIWSVLDAANWCLQLDGDGNIYILEKPDSPELILDQANARLMGVDLSYEENLDDIPNVYYVTDGEISYTARNEDPDSPTSIPSRDGREIDAVDLSPTRVNGETLTAYAERMLKEVSSVMRTYSYSREYWPGVYIFDMVQGGMASMDFLDNMRVMSQSIDCSHGIYISEKAGLVIEEYTP